MIRLEKFSESDFDRLINWIDSKEALVQFAGPIFQFPITKVQLRAYVEMKDKEPYKVILNENDEVIGHCEINLGNQFPRLSRILIGAENNRGKGIGRAIVKEMVLKIQDKFPGKPIDLNVFAWNTGAIRCYEKAGFTIIDENTDILEYEGLNWTRLNMQFKLNNL